MVATVEIVFLIARVILGLWWFGWMTTFRTHLKLGVDPGRRPRDRSRAPQGGQGTAGWCSA